MRRWLRFVPIVMLVLAALPGCSQVCTLVAIPAVDLTIVDAETGGSVRSLVTVTFRVDDGEIEEPSEQYGNERFQLLGDAGHYEVTIEAEGYETVSVEYEITRDECHVDGVTDTIELVPTP